MHGAWDKGQELYRKECMAWVEEQGVQDRECMARGCRIGMYCRGQWVKDAEGRGWM